MNLNLITIVEIFIGVVAADVFMNIVQYCINKHAEAQISEEMVSLMEGYQ